MALQPVPFDSERSGSLRQYGRASSFGTVVFDDEPLWSKMSQPQAWKGPNRLHLRHPRPSFSRSSCSLRKLHPHLLKDEEEELLQPVLRATARVSTEAVKLQMREVAGPDGRLDLDSLEKHGFTTEDLSRVIYDRYKDKDLPNCLDYVTLEKRGGLDRISEIWSAEKYLWFAFLVGSMLFNTASLLIMDWAIFKSFAAEMLGLFGGVDFKDSAKALTVEFRSQTGDVFKGSTMDIQTRQLLLNIAAMVATWEICWIIVKALHALYIWGLFSIGRSEYKSFYGIMYFFQKLLPQFSTFSAIKLLAKVHPSLVYNEYLHFLRESSLRATRSGQILVSTYFICKCVLCVMAATGAFTIKLLAVSAKLHNSACSLVNKFGGILSLMLQCMGCVVMEVVLQDRLFLFVFGGQDATFSDMEHAYKNMYECRVARQIWKDFWSKGMRLKAIVLLATFDHYDLQRLIIARLDDHAVDLEGLELVPIQETPQDTEGDGEEEQLVAVPDPGDHCERPEEPPMLPKLPLRALLLKESPPSDRTGSPHSPSTSARQDSCPCTPQASTTRCPPVTSARQAQAEEEKIKREDTACSASSAGSGMKAVTRCLRGQDAWREAV